MVEYYFSNKQKMVSKFLVHGTNLKSSFTHVRQLHSMNFELFNISLDPCCISIHNTISNANTYKYKQ
ncbi:MAG: hypothetical protein Sylvanvirus5_9 [Sylvanvirus sp.]|uniref:Uncharacterized protein n=1 Tax=Sylvanvirus sp. TaxID=2487774 RepID=A0A3G5AJJ8_9VIRU|nr:MAG: hypothetical protein Sylvanvirus5_9 [Sylvanvirus sp.]